MHKYQNYSFLHDTEIISVAVDNVTNTVKLQLRQEDGHIRVMLISGIKLFRCTDLIHQNVIYQLRLSSTGQVAGDDLEFWLKWGATFSSESSWLKPDTLFEWRTACENGKLELVHFEPSYGAQIVALCEKFELH